MTEEHHSPENNEEEDFAKLMESYDNEPMSELHVGDKINAKVIAIEEKTVFVDTGTKVDGAVDKTSLLDKEGNLTVKKGDTLELYVIAMTESEIELSKSVPSAAGLSMLREAFQSRIPVEGKVQQTIKGGFHIVIAQKRAFCPISSMDTKYVEDPEIYVGETFQFLIKQFEGNGKNIVVSRKDLLEKKEKAARKEFVEQMTTDSVLQGRVVRIMPYGAFVELCPGLEGMIHISELSWRRVETAEEAVSIGDTVTVKVIQIGKKEKKDQLKIGLSIKQAQDDPWNSVSSNFKAGDRIHGKVTRILDFGAFVEISAGIEGLVHISEMSYVKRVSKPQEIVKEGEGVYVQIKDIDTGARRISLSLREVDGDPWQGVDEKYTVGQTIKGIFRKKENFGLFIEIEPGVIGLLPKSKIGKASNPSMYDKLKDGDIVELLVEEINSAMRKMTLNITEAKEEGNWKSYTKSSKSASSGLGTLGEKLQQALKQKKTP